MTRFMRRWLVSAAVLAVAGSAGAQQPLNQHNGDGPGGTFFPEMLANRVDAALPTNDYLLVAIRNTAFERRAAELAQAQARSPRVKRFADRMSDDSELTTSRLQAAAQAAGVAPLARPEPSAGEQSALDRLHAAHGAAFDRLYLGMQMQEQLAMEGLHTNYHYNGASRPVRAAAAREIPVVEQHLSLLNSMRGLS